MYFEVIHKILRPDILAELSVNSFEAMEQIYEVLMSGILTENGINEFKEKTK